MNTTTTQTTPRAISGDATMARVLEVYPGAQRALFRKYHIGGCSSCGFDPNETLAQVCARNNHLNVAEVIAHIEQSHAADQQIYVSAQELSRWRAENVAARLVDIRTREEFDATHIPGATLFTQEIMTEMLGRWPRAELVVIYDHLGNKSMDAAAYFLGHGFTNVRALRGGIDAWAEIDSTIRKYRLD
ncbi:MAG TPA: rhodanese-like domain-containing protein [Verrucomicrobiae bacterium]